MIADKIYDLNHLISILETRKFVYQFLQSIFQTKINTEFLLKGKDQIPFQFLTEISEGGTNLSQFFSFITENNVDQFVKTEGEEFQRLFIGPNVLPAPPWESVYRSHEKILFNESTFSFREKLSEFGLKYVKENNEPEDHIAIQLSFMSYLIEQQIQGLRENDEASFTRSLQVQYTVLEEHLTQWVFEFTKDLLVATNSLLYQGASKLLRDFIQEEKLYLSEEKGAITHE